jgi:hypothetical protein
VDLILETGDGKIIGIEVKLSPTITARRWDSGSPACSTWSLVGSIVLFGELAQLCNFLRAELGKVNYLL